MEDAKLLPSDLVEFKISHLATLYVESGKRKDEISISHSRTASVRSKSAFLFSSARKRPKAICSNM